MSVIDRSDVDKYELNNFLTCSECSKVYGKRLFGENKKIK